MRLCALLAAGVSGSFAFAGPLAGDSSFQQLLTMYTAPSATDSANVVAPVEAKEPYYIGQLKNGAFGKPETFATKARLAFKTDRRQMVVGGRAFRVGSSALPRANGWRNKGELYYFPRHVGDRGSPLFLPLVQDKGQKSSRFGDFNQFWIDYTPLPGIPLCTPQVGFRLTVSPYTGDSSAPHSLLARSGAAYYALKTLTTINVAKATWKQRDYVYLARRVLGLSPDEDWRYVQSRKIVVLQRRLHKRIDNVEAIDIALSPGTSIARVNLMVSRKDNYGAGELVQFGGLSKNSTLLDGRPSVRLNLREALKTRFPKAWVDHVKEPGKQHFYLQEVFIFIRGQVDTIAAEKPVRRFEFLGDKWDQTKPTTKIQAKIIKLTSNVVALNASRRRIVVDLRKLEKKGRVSLKRAGLALLPPKGAMSCGIRFDGVQAVSTYDGSLPVFARQVGNWSRRWGGPFGAASAQYGKVQNPGIIDYLPFATLTSPGVRGDGAMRYLVTVGENRQLQFRPASVRSQPLPYRLEKPAGRIIAADTASLISSVGASLRAEGALPRCTENNDLLVLDGRSRALDISWPLKARLNEKTWFYFGVAEGANQIGDMVLTLGLADGRVIQRHVVANQPLRLLASKEDVRKVSLRIVPAIIPYRLGLRELAFFSPHAVSYAQAFTVPLPTPYNVAPKPVLLPAHQPLLIVQRGRIAGLTADLAAGGPLRFSTPIDPKLGWVRGVRLNYRLPLVYGGDGGCPLTLRFNWENGKTERRVCLEKPSGAIFIPLASWLGAANKMQNLGALQSIDWVLRPATGAHRGIPESFDLRFSVEGWAMLSAADRLHTSPVFYAGGHPVFAEGIKEAAASGYSRKIWLPLERQALPLMLAASGNIRPAENGLFTLDQVAAEPKRPMDWGRWLKLTELPRPYAPSRWPKWLFWASASLLAWAAWKKGWWAPGKLWALGKGGVKVVYRPLLWVLGRMGRWGWRQLPRFNLVIGGLALGPGLWEAGRLGLGFPGVMVLAAAGLVAWGAYCHWREQCRPPAGSAARHARFVALGVALGCAIWSLGQYGPSAGALWGFLPLFGAAYALLPALYRWGRGLVLYRRTHASLGGWLAVTLGLYGLGLVAKADTGENYLFTFGGMAAVLALRAGWLMIEPRLRRLFPAAADHIYGGAGSLYFSGALVMLVLTAAMVSVKLEPIAEQFAVIVYYCLVVGAVLEILTFRREARARDKAAAEEFNG